MIRPATLGDAPDVAALWNWMIRDTLATFTTQEKTVIEIEEMIACRQAAFFIAEADTAVKGFVTFGPFRSGPGYATACEHSVIVDPKARGAGVGRALMVEAQTTACAQGKRMMIAAISSANPQAEAFHRNLGFAKVGHLPQVGHKAGQWLDLILMQKNLIERA